MAINAEQNQLQKANEQKDSQAQQPGQAMAGSGGVSGPQSRTASFSSGSQPTQGSGRFTNLKNYIGANQGAGERLAQGISKNIGQQTSESKGKAETQASAVREGIQSAQGKIGTGTGYKSQLEAPDFNAEQFVADKDKLNEFGQFRTGTAIDQQGLQRGLGEAQQAGLGYQSQLQNVGQQVGTEQGRFGLLKDTFGGKSTYANPYSAGQQRLDQLFLQSGGGNQIQNLQSGIRSDLNKAGQNLAQVDQYGNQITDVAGQAKTLAEQLQGKTNELETGYITGLEGQVAGVNTDRDAQQANYKKFFKGITGQDVSQPLNQDILGESGLKVGQQTFNVLNDPNLTAEQVMKFDPRTAGSYKDIANQGNVNYYGALSKLAGIDGSKLNQVGQLIDPATGKIANAASFVQGENSLTGRIGAARAKLLGDTTGFSAGKELTYGTGVDTLTPANQSGFNNFDSINYGQQRVGNTSSANVADYLKDLTAKNSYYYGGAKNPSGARAGVANTVESDTQAAITNALRNAHLNPDGSLMDNNNKNYGYSGTFNAGGAQAGTGQQDVINRATNAVNTVTGDTQSRVKQQMLDYLGNQGFYNYLGATGAQTGDRDIAAYGYGGTNKDNPTGMYTPKSDVSK